MQMHKVTRNSAGKTTSLFGQLRVSGYEIHVGQTRYLDNAESFATLDSGEPDGCVSRRVIGTYLHGIFDDDEFRHAFITSASGSAPSSLNPWKAQREASLDRLAREVRQALDMQQIFSWVGM
jgi:adenosylcobyric acid synthase